MFFLFSSKSQQDPRPGPSSQPKDDLNEKPPKEDKDEGNSSNDSSSSKESKPQPPEPVAAPEPQPQQPQSIFDMSEEALDAFDADYLLRLEQILTEIHRLYYRAYDKQQAELAKRRAQNKEIADGSRWADFRFNQTYLNNLSRNVFFCDLYTTWELSFVMRNCVTDRFN